MSYAKHKYKTETFLKENGISYYLLGAFMTDGCVYSHLHTATLTSKDKDWLELINIYISPNKNIIKHGKNCYRAIYNSKIIKNWLISKGCFPKKSLTIQFPNIPEQYLKDFIRGCWDGDGCLSFTKSANKGTSYQRQASFTTGSKQFAESMYNILISMGIKCKLYNRLRIKNRYIEGRKLPTCNSFEIVMSSGLSTYDLCKSLYTSNKITMPRKKQIAQAIITDWENNVRHTNHRS